MKHETAKSLKDNGFVQVTPREPWCLVCNSNKTMSCYDEKHKTEYLTFPKVHQIIEQISGYICIEKTEIDWSVFWSKKPFTRPPGIEAIDIGFELHVSAIELDEALAAMYLFTIKHKN